MGFVARARAASCIGGPARMALVCATVTLCRGAMPYYLIMPVISSHTTICSQGIGIELRNTCRARLISLCYCMFSARGVPP